MKKFHETCRTHLLMPNDMKKYRVEYGDGSSETLEAESIEQALEMVTGKNQRIVTVEQIKEEVSSA